MIAMFTVGPGVLERISKYMSCDIDRLINTGIKVDENNKAQSVKSTKEIILDILNALPGNKEYKNLQVYISTVIITNLLKLGIGKSKLIEAGLPEICRFLRSYNIFQYAFWILLWLRYPKLQRSQNQGYGAAHRWSVPLQEVCSRR